MNRVAWKDGCHTRYLQTKAQPSNVLESEKPIFPAVPGRSLRLSDFLLPFFYTSNIIPVAPIAQITSHSQHTLYCDSKSRPNCFACMFFIHFPKVCTKIWQFVSDFVCVLLLSSSLRFKRARASVCVCVSDIPSQTHFSTLNSNHPVNIHSHRSLLGCSQHSCACTFRQKVVSNGGRSARTHKHNQPENNKNNKNKRGKTYISMRSKLSSKKKHKLLGFFSVPVVKFYRVLTNNTRAVLNSVVCERLIV